MAFLRQILKWNEDTRPLLSYLAEEKSNEKELKLTPMKNNQI